MPPEDLAQPFIGEKVADVKAALDGVRDILSERFSQHPDTAARIRLLSNGLPAEGQRCGWQGRGRTQVRGLF